MRQAERKLVVGYKAISVAAQSKEEKTEWSHSVQVWQINES
jgi:hypothetical protein